MKRVLLSLVMVVVMVLLCVAPVMASQPDKGLRGTAGAVGNLGNGFLELWEKSTDWQIVEDGAWGKIKYNEDGYLLNAHKLLPNTEYDLVAYEGYPNATLIGTATSDVNGNLHLAGDVAFSGLPQSDEDGTKVWLVLSSDFTDVFVSWHQSEYLFEHHLIN